jgi:hypothetical protein
MSKKYNLGGQALILLSTSLCHSLVQYTIIEPIVFYCILDNQKYVFNLII